MTLGAAPIALGPLATPEMRADFRARMGLDQPFLSQYLTFLGNVAVGDLGVDVWSKRPVTTLIAEQLPHTLVLALVGLGWAILLGIPLGCLSAVRRNSLFDKLTGVLSVACIAIPSFTVALYALLLFAVTWQ